MAEQLRIAQVAPVASAVVRDSGRSIEQLVWLLTEELVRRGHTVTLFATGDSQTSANLHAVYRRGYEETDDLWDWRFHEMLHMASVFEQAHNFDIVHSHAYHYALPFTRLVNIPVVHTCHVLPNRDIIRAYARYSEAHIVAVSRYQRRTIKGRPGVGVVHHGIDIDAFPFNPARGDYALFLGRFIPRKGPVEAIRLARQAGIRLVMAGNADDDNYFRSAVVPLIDGRRVEYVGPVHGQERNALLAGAAALFYPVMAAEPFGLVMIEAMACGTPVAALARGPVPEIVEQGVTGYFARDLESLSACIPAVLELDRACVRQTAVARFDYRRMVDDYLAVYHRLAVNQRRQEAP